MSVKIRLRRDGAKKRPFYHVVAADSRRARNGRFIEELGYYNPMMAADVEPTLVLKHDRIQYWLSVGAQPSETAAALLKKQGLLARRVPTAPKTAAAAPVADAAPVATDATPAAAPVETPAATATEETTTAAETAETTGEPEATTGA